MSTVVEVVPAELVASIVKVIVEGVTVVGVPIILSSCWIDQIDQVVLTPAAIAQEVGVPAV